MSDELNIIIGIVMIALTANSWYMHYVVKDGAARVILLWLNGLLFTLFTLRVIGYLLVEVEVLNIITSRTWNQWIFLILYSIPVMQQWVQRYFIVKDEPKLKKKGGKK